MPIPTVISASEGKLSRLFRRLFLEKLVAAHKAGRLTFFGNHAPLADNFIPY